MPNSSVTTEPEEVPGKSSLAVRAANAPKDGGSSVPPTLFRHTSMQRIRHCCQNLNLLPYLLYSFDNSKSHPIARKVHLCLDQLLEMITVRVFFLCKSFRGTIVRGIRGDKLRRDEDPARISEAAASAPRFRTLCRQKRKQNNHPLILTLAVYFAPLLLTFQLIGLFSLMVFGKYTPGFVFLTFALLFLGCISLKILVHGGSEPIGGSGKIKTQ